MSLLGSLQGALGGKEMAGGVIGLVVSATDLHGKGRCCVSGRESLQTRCLTCFLGQAMAPSSPATLTLSPSGKAHVGPSLPWATQQLLSHLLEDAGGGGAAGGVLAHTHGRVVVIHLAHLAVLAVVVLAGVCSRRGARSEPATSSPPTRCSGHLSTERRQRLRQRQPPASILAPGRCEGFQKSMLALGLILDSFL